MNAFTFPLVRDLCRPPRASALAANERYDAFATTIVANIW